MKTIFKISMAAALLSLSAFSSSGAMADDTDRKSTRLNSSHAL